MTINTTKPDSLQPTTEMAVDLFDNWFDPIETEVRGRARQFIEELIRGELDAAVPVGNLIRLASEAESRNVSGL
jgi:putative transposase